MGLSVLDLFKIGLGPSSSHTVGPMVAGNRFVNELVARKLMDQVASVRVELFGSLAMTGKGHATDTAIMQGLSGEQPDQIDPDYAPQLVANIRESQKIDLGGVKAIPFNEKTDLKFCFGQSLPKHPNGMTLSVSDEAGIVVYRNNYYSVGGGFVLSEEETDQTGETSDNTVSNLPYPFENGEDLLVMGRQSGLSIAEMALANEVVLERSQDIKADLLHIRDVMCACIDRGCVRTGILPGGLGVKRRANSLHADILKKQKTGDNHLEAMDWVNLFAMAVNEENAVGGRVVTAPTNGAAGVIPAVLAYFEKYLNKKGDDGIVEFLATAAAIGMLYKKNASISAAEVGCQGEIGVACSMAAGALCAVQGGSNEQIENAAEIGMEHNLGLTCDPIAGLVQVPCIERNTMGAVKALNAARLALNGDGNHRVHLDEVIQTMYQTGLDMHEKYRETATGGLAVNAVAC